jgi:hypothetical protein
MEGFGEGEVVGVRTRSYAGAFGNGCMAFSVDCLRLCRFDLSQTTDTSSYHIPYATMPQCTLLLLRFL